MELLNIISKEWENAGSIYKKTDMNNRVVRIYLEKLENFGLIEIKKETGKSSIIRLK